MSKQTTQVLKANGMLINSSRHVIMFDVSGESTESCHEYLIGAFIVLPVWLRRKSGLLSVCSLIGFIQNNKRLNMLGPSIIFTSVVPSKAPISFISLTAGGVK